MICLCDVVILIGFVYMITLHVSTSIKNLLMLVHIHLTYYLYVLFFVMILLIKKANSPLNVKGWSAGVLSLQGPLGKVRFPTDLRGLLSSLQTNAGSYSCAGYSGGELYL